jgi:hypothetical protein
MYILFEPYSSFMCVKVYIWREREREREKETEKDIYMERERNRDREGDRHNFILAHPFSPKSDLKFFVSRNERRRKILTPTPINTQ